jgi:hypothetical protein
MTDEQVIKFAQTMRALMQERWQWNERFGDDSRAIGEHMIEKFKPFLTEEQFENLPLMSGPSAWSTIFLS